MPGEITRSSLALSAGNNSMTCRYSSQNTLASNLQFALDDGIGVHGLIAREDPHHREPSAPRAARPPTAPLGPDTGIGYDQVTRLQIDHTSAHCENLYRSVRKLCRSEPQTPAARVRSRAANHQARGPARSEDRLPHASERRASWSMARSFSYLRQHGVRELTLDPSPKSRPSPTPASKIDARLPTRCKITDAHRHHASTSQYSAPWVAKSLPSCRLGGETAVYGTAPNVSSDAIRVNLGSTACLDIIFTLQYE